MYWKNYFTTIAFKAVFVSGEMEIRKIFYTLECVWVCMKIWSNWKSISVDCKLNPLDLEIGLHGDFTFNQFPLSSLTHTKPKERERETQLLPPPIHLRRCLLSPNRLCRCLHSPIHRFLLSSPFHLFLFSSPVSLFPYDPPRSNLELHVINLQPVTTSTISLPSLVFFLRFFFFCK